MRATGQRRVDTAIEALGDRFKFDHIVEAHEIVVHACGTHMLEVRIEARSLVPILDAAGGQPVRPSIGSGARYRRGRGRAAAGCAPASRGSVPMAVSVQGTRCTRWC